MSGECRVKIRSLVQLHPPTLENVTESYPALCATLVGFVRGEPILSEQRCFSELNVSKLVLASFGETALAEPIGFVWETTQIAIGFVWKNGGFPR